MRANDFFTLVFGHEVGVLKVLGLDKHVLAKQPRVQASRGNGGDVVKMFGLYRLGQRHGVAGAVNVDGDLAGLVSIQVIDCRQVIEMVNLALKLFDLGGRQAQPAAVQVTRQRHYAGGAGTPVLSQCRRLGLALRAQQVVHHRALVRQQLFDQAFADEPGRTGHEIMHVFHPCRPSAVPLAI